MKKELRIPTLIALVILVLGVTITSVVAGQAQRFFLKADVNSQPKNVKITNITDTSFSVSWTTDAAVAGVVSYKEISGSYKPVQDDRVQSGQAADKFYTHHVTVRFLSPTTSYVFKIVSANQDYTDESYKLTTGTPIGNSDNISFPVYGTVLNNDKTPGQGVLVYVSVNDSSVLSTISKSSGNWLVTLNSARTKALNSYALFQTKGDRVDVLFQGMGGKVSSVKTLTENAAPVSTVILGNDYDLTKEQLSMAVAEKSISPTPTFTPSPTAVAEKKETITSTPTVTITTGITQTITPTPTENLSLNSGFTPTPAVGESPAILTPKTNSTISDYRPVIQGVGVPGQIVQILVHSQQEIAASVVVGSDGRWSWTPSVNLDPGEHTVTIATPDSSGKVKTVSQNFLVLGSGTSVVESATPSASLTPTFTPTPSASPSPLPKTGSTSFTSLLLFFGVSILFLGTVLFYASVI